MTEPVYIAQTAEKMTAAEAFKWASDRAKESHRKGGHFGRISIHPEYGWVLYEGWPSDPGPDVEPYWQVLAPEGK